MTEERALLRDAARRSLAAELPPGRLNDGVDAALANRAWSLAASQGWTGLLVPEERGGLALGLSDVAVLSEELGRGLFPGPIAATAVLGASLAAGAPDIQAGIVDGSVRIAVSWPDDLRSGMAVQPAPVERQGIIHGSLILVEYPVDATHCLLLDRDRAILVPAAGLPVALHQPFDLTCPMGAVDCGGTRLADCLLLSVDPRLIDTAMARAAVAMAAELVGVAAAALDMTLGHVGERRQFGVPLGSFQALKHRLADTYLLVENARTATAYAAAVQDAGGIDRGVALDAAASCAVEAALTATADAVQLHGAIGYAWEHGAHLYLKRARRLAANLGQPDEARARIAATLMQNLSRGAEFLFPPLSLETLDDGRP